MIPQAGKSPPLRRQLKRPPIPCPRGRRTGAGVSRVYQRAIDWRIKLQASVEKFAEDSRTDLPTFFR
jgi:hypothetical protein